MIDPLSLSLGAVDRDWFFAHAAVKDPEVAWARWREWLARTRIKAPYPLYHKLLEIAGGVRRTAVTLYVSPNGWSQLSRETLWDLDHISNEVGVSRPRRNLSEIQKRTEVRGTWRIALLCELAGIPSPRFHVEVLRSLVESRQTGNIAISIHAVQPTAAGFHAALQRMIRLERPDGAIWFRITPDASSLELLNGVPNLRPPVPTVVVHGAIQEYPAPVLGHVFPDQSNLAEAVKGWARKLRAGDVASREVAVVSMRREAGDITSIRNQRIALIHAGIQVAGLSPHHIEVPDYSAAHADFVVSECPHALGYVCLSDEIAVGVKYLLAATGRRTADNVVGFDHSPMITHRDIPSFNQNLEQIGEATLTLLLDFFRRQEDAPWPPFRPVPLPLELG